MTITVETEYDDFQAFEDSLKEKACEIIEKAVMSALCCEENPYECEINVLLCGDERIRSINSEQRGIDRSTDVLSFPMCEYDSPASFDGFDDMPWLFNPETGELMLGDIVISIDHVMAQAEEYGHGRERELAFLTVHSMLHLMGYDHMEDSEREIMEERQREALLSAGYTR